MPEPEPSPAVNTDAQPPFEVDQFIVYAGYGEVMHRLQVLEMSLWGIQTRGIKPNTTLDQALNKVARWNNTTLGEMLRGMRNQPHWPEGLIERLLDAVEARNYLAHHFLREYFLVRPSPTNREHATETLADLSVRLDRLIDEVDAHAATLGVVYDEALDQETREAIDALRPSEWLSDPGLRD